MFIQTLAVANYRSLREIVLPLGNLTVVTGANGSGKSNLYRALRLLSDSANGQLIKALAQDGGLESCMWAGPESIARAMRTQEIPVQGGPRQRVVRLHLGFSTDEFSYAISLGLPSPGGAGFFQLDPEIKRESIWVGKAYRPSACLVERVGPLVKIKEGRSWTVHVQNMNTFDSLLAEVADPVALPEVFAVRRMIRGWRFYDAFRTDRDSPLRVAQVGTRSPVLDHDGHNFVAALQTIREIGDAKALAEAIDDAFPGSRLNIQVESGSRFVLQLHQPGLLRPLNQSELSDGTLRYLLLIAALLTPRPPTLLVLNEPETSLHPDLLPALARLIIKVSEKTQVWVVSHATRLVAALKEANHCECIALEKSLGETQVTGQGLLDKPLWRWPDTT